MQENQVPENQVSENKMPKNQAQKVEQRPLNGRVLVSDCLERQEFNTQLLYFTCSSLAENDAIAVAVQMSCAGTCLRGRRQR